jgi:hypothetical protein
MPRIRNTENEALYAASPAIIRAAMKYAKVFLEPHLVHNAKIDNQLISATVLRIRMFILDPDPSFSHPESASENLSILTQKMVSKLSEI